MDTTKILAARFNALDTPVKFSIENYCNNGRMCLDLVTDDEIQEPFATLTVNIVEARLEENEIIVKTWSENESIAKAALETGLFENTGKLIPTGYVNAQVWKVLQ